MSNDNLDLDFLSDDLILEPQEETIVQDDGERGLKLAFIGVGQAGNAMCSTLWEQGYRRVIQFNTTANDLQTSTVPKKWSVLASGYEGAGKNRQVGRKAAQDNSQEVLELMQQRFKNVDFIFIVTSAGGGTGSGASPVFAGLAASYLAQQMNISQEQAMSKVGVIAAIPKPQEGSVVGKNAREFLSEFITDKGNSRGHVLLLVDNARAEKKLPKNISVTGVNTAINTVVLGLFDTLNKTSSRHSEFYAFDPKDYSGILSSGIISIGISRLNRIDSDADIARAVKYNMSESLMVDNIKIETGTHAGLIIVAGDNCLQSITNQAVTKAQEFVNSVMSEADANKKVCINLGVYRQNREVVDIITVFGGMKFATDRM